MLGWVSIGLGVTGLLAAPAVARSLGLEGKESFIRACGARELASGVVCLSVNPGLGLAMRAAGDALDLAALVAARGASNGKEGNVNAALAAVAGLTALDLACLAALRAERAPGTRVAEEPRRDYSDRSGLPRGVVASRGLARGPAVEASRPVDTGAAAAEPGAGALEAGAAAI